MAMKILARHRWIDGTVITESGDTETDTPYHRFTATIRGWRNWKIYEGFLSDNIAQRVFDAVMEIRGRIDAEDESIFEHKGFWLT